MFSPTLIIQKPVPSSKQRHFLKALSNHYREFIYPLLYTHVKQQTIIVIKA